MTLQERLFALIESMKSETKAIRSFVTGTDSGDAAGLNTAAVNLVAAINEIKAAADSDGGYASINDAVTNSMDAWSGSKIGLTRWRQRLPIRQIRRMFTRKRSLATPTRI